MCGDKSRMHEDQWSHAYQSYISSPFHIVAIAAFCISLLLFLCSLPVARIHRMHVCSRKTVSPSRSARLQPKQRGKTRSYSLLQKWGQLTASPVVQQTKQVGVVLVDHGSRRPAANESLEEFASLFRKTTTHKIVEIAHMELAEPTIAQAIEKCSQNGCTHVVVLPYFLSKGRHVTEDIPHLVQQATEGLPNLSVQIAEPIGTMLQASPACCTTYYH
jgi:sirohydrochlorin ferrochelatase